MNPSRAYIMIGILAMLLLTACGQQHQAKSLVKDFVEEHAIEELHITDFSDLDSTKVISDSVFLAMQQNAAKISPTSTPPRSSATRCFWRCSRMQPRIPFSKTSISAI